MVNYTLYTSQYDTLPESEMMGLIPFIKPEISITDEKCYEYKWQDLTVRCSEMSQAEMPDHLRGFLGYIKNLYRHKGFPMDQNGLNICNRIANTTLVVGIQISPEVDAEGRCDEMIGKMAGGLKPLIFYNDAIYDSNSSLLLSANI